MKTEKNISLFEANKIAVLLFLAIFAMHACGPKPLTSGGGGGEQLTQVEDLDPDNVFQDLCFGNDTDDNGVCDDEEDIECIDDPNCEDDPDVEIDGLNSSYKSGGSMGRWIGAIAGIAAGAGAAYGLVGASGLVTKKGEKKWGWLHKLIQDNPDKDGLGFLRLLRADNKTLAGDVVDINFEAEEQFYTHPVTMQPWVTVMRKLELSPDLNFAVFINGKNHGGPVVNSNAEVKKAGRVILTCVSGMKQFVDTSFNANVTKTVATEDGGTSPQQFSSARINVLMDKSYLSVKDDTLPAKEWFKAKKTEEQFENHCRDATTGGAWVALQLNDKTDESGNQLYFVNPMPTSIFTNAGFGAIETTMENYAGVASNFGGFYIDYLLSEGGATISDDATIDYDTVVTARRYSDILNISSGHYNIPLTSSQVNDYNDIFQGGAYADVQLTRAKYLMGMFTGTEILCTQDERTNEQISTNQVITKEETVTPADAQGPGGVEIIDELGRKITFATVNNKTKDSPYAGATTIIYTNKVIFEGGQ